MAEGTLQILGLGTSAVPLEYTASGDQSLDLVAVNADYDGTSAMVDWQPVVEIVSDAGEVMARGVGPTITAGDSASVTFAPFLKEQATQTSGGGIQFNTEPQSGTYLYTQTTGADGTFGYAYVWDDVNQNGTLYTGPVFGDSGSVGFNTWSLGRGNGFRFRLLSGAASFGVSGVGGIITAFSDFAVDKLSFFTAAPVAQQATPVTLADVIALLQAYGLSA